MFYSFPGETYLQGFQNLAGLRTGKTTIPGYTLRNYVIVCGNEKVVIDKLEPGQEKTFKIKAKANQFSIIRPTGFEVANHKF